MNQSSHISRRASTLRAFAFEDFVSDLFIRLGYSVEREVRTGGLSIDMVVKRDGLGSPVEVSIPRGAGAVPRLMHDAARVRSVVAEDGSLSSPIVIIGSPLTESMKAWSEKQFDLRVWDSEMLREKAAPFPDLRQKLAALLEDQPPREEPAADVVRERQALLEALRGHIENNTLTSSAYEKLCMSVFQHLFDPHLYGFEAQAETVDGGNRYDFICRILPGNPFWDGLRQDFRTKAILFECKNYEQKIGPDQVYSTERYLFSGALRTVCLLVSRFGPNAGAIRAAQGAMRESGKLLILLSNQDLIEMLLLKTQEGGPEGFLDKKIWDFVVSLPR